MTKYFELLHGSVEEGGGVKCIKGGESTFFRVFKLIVKNQGKKCYTRNSYHSATSSHTVHILYYGNKSRFLPVILAGALSRYAF